METKVLEFMEALKNQKNQPLAKYETHCEKHGQFVEADHRGLCWACMDEDRTTRKEQERQHQLLKWQHEAGIGKRYHQASFAAIKENQRQIADQLQAYDFEKNIMLIGKTGVGKTHLALALINSVIETRVCFFVKFYKLAHIQIREAEKFQALLDCDFLVIDEFGVAGSDYKDTIIYEIFDYRFENKLPTMMISNLTAEELRAKLSDAVLSRIKSNCLSLVLLGDDLRVNGGAA